MFEKEHFKNLRHNPFDVPKGVKMSEHYPLLGRVKAFTEVPSLTSAGAKSYENKSVLTMADVDTMVKFVVLFVEPRGNPLARERNFDERSNQAWRLLGIGNTHSLRSLQQKGHWWFHGTLFEYFKVTWGPMYEEWFAQKMAFHHLAKALAKPMLETETDDQGIASRLKISAALKSMRKTIDELEATMFKDQETLEIVAEQSHFGRLAEKYAIDYPVFSTNLN